MTLFSGSQQRRKRRPLTLADQPVSLPLYNVFPTNHEAHSVPSECVLDTTSELGRQAPLETSPSPARRIAKWTDSLRTRRKLFKVGKDTKEDDNVSTSSTSLTSSPQWASQPAPTLYVSIPHSRLSSGSLNEYLCADRHASEPILDLPILAVVN
jgi:hypothetical protein